MEPTSTAAIAAQERPYPRAFLDGGGESGEVLLSAIEHLLGALAPGQTLEVVSCHPDARTDVPLWCLSSGHILLHIEITQSSTVFWIRTRGIGGQSETVPP